ncbi:hypothetical protein P8452_40609 [Trifolium repens]|nr:hypothetical protein P8452_40609 [Trifolium repens]
MCMAPRASNSSKTMPPINKSHMVLSLTRPRLFTVSSSSKSVAAAGIEVGIGALTHSHSHLTRFLFFLSLTGFVSFLAPPLNSSTHVIVLFWCERV